MRCSFCKSKIESWKEIILGIKTLCSEKCKKEFIKKSKEEQREKEKVKKEKLYNELSLRIQWLEEDKREEFRKEMNQVLPKYLWNKQLIIKAKRRKPISKIKSLKHKLDEVFSLYIRARDKKCVICWNTETLQNWHYYSRVNNSTRFNEMNCNTQCSACNCLHEYNITPYKEFMIKRYWKNALALLYLEHIKTVHFKEKDYKELIELYKYKLKQLWEI